MLNIYRGRETVDKEKFIYSKIKEIGGRTLVIVPDQYTLVAEKQALKKLNSKVLLDIEILSFSRLGLRLLEEAGTDDKKIINRYGRHMLISKILRDENENLDAFKGMWNRENFVAAVNNFISTAKQYESSPSALKGLLIKRDEDTALSRKLKDISYIYEKYEDLISGHYTDAEDMISMYREAASSSKRVADSNIWIYGFDSFTPKNLSFVSALIGQAKSVNIFLTWDTNCRDEDLFRLSEMVTVELQKAAEEIEAQYSVVDFGRKEKEEFAVIARSEGISNLEKELFSVGTVPLEGSEAYDGITLVKCGSPYSEAEAAASHIRSLLMEKSYRLSDILIICNDQKERGGIISRVFQEYGLEVFDDKKRQVINSSLPILISALLETMICGYRTEDIMRALKTGLTDIDREDVVELEEYAIRLRIRGTLWKHEFTRGSYMSRYAGSRLEEIENVRKKIMPTFLSFERIYKESKTYESFIENLKDFLDVDLRIKEKMAALAETQRSIEALDVAAETEQLRDIIWVILDQIEEILGDTPFDGKEFNDILKAGLSQIEIGVLPPSADDMLVGTMQRTRSGDVKAVVVTGANDGIIPLSPNEDILFSKEEMTELEGSGIAFGIDNEIKRMEEDIALYRCLFKPEEDLWISYSTAGVNGGALQPSEVVSTIKKIFKDIKEIEDPNLSDDISLRLGGETNTLRRYSEALREKKLGLEQNPEWNLVQEWLKAKDEKTAQNSLATIEENAEFTNIEENLGSEIASEMFGSAYSPSRLENFSGCPYRHFVSAGLGAEEMRVDEAAGREIGELYHGILEKFAGELTEKNLWNTIDKKEAEKLIEKFADEWAEEYHDKLFKVSSKEKYLLKRAITASKFVAWTLVEQARSGEIEESRYEVRFGRFGSSGDGKEILKPIERTLSNGRKVYIEGRIDRMDLLESGRVKIVDYKTGYKSFDLNEVKAGYSLQLMLYLEAAREGRRKPAGVFYFLINEPDGRVGEIIEPEEREEFEEALRSKYPMDGIIVDDADVIREIAGEFEGSSSVVKLTRTQKGFSKYSEKHLISEEDLNELQNEVVEVTTKICEDILAGRIELKPKKVRKNDPCKYCDYHSICNFDRSFSGCTYEYV